MQNPSDFASYHQSILNKLFYGKQTCEKLLPALSNKDFSESKIREKNDRCRRHIMNFLVEKGPK